MPATKPLCRCRVLYIGSAVPTITKDGLQGIQEPLRERYPIDNTTNTKGIDAWLSVWSNGLLLEYVQGQDNENDKDSTFFPIESLHYCAAVRFVNVSGYSVEGGGEKFLPLDSPFANLPSSTHPPVFAAMLRKTTGVRVLECHSFIATNAKAANALVRCCFHAYADNMYLKVTGVEERLQLALPAPPTMGLKAIKGREAGGSSRSTSPSGSDAAVENGYHNGEDDSDAEVLRWNEKGRGKATGWQRRQQGGEYDSYSISSSLADRYATKRSARNSRPPSEPGYVGALVPYEPPVGTWKSQRSNRAMSERDFATYGTFGGYRARGGMSPPPPASVPGSTMAMVPYFSPQQQFGPGGPRPGMMHPPPPGSIIFGPPGPPHIRGPMFDPRIPRGFPPDPRAPPGMMPSPGFMTNGTGPPRTMEAPGRMPFEAHTLPSRSMSPPPMGGPGPQQQTLRMRPPMRFPMMGPPRGPLSPQPRMPNGQPMPPRGAFFRPPMMHPGQPHMGVPMPVFPQGGRSMSPPPFVGRQWNGFDVSSPYGTLPRRAFEEPPMGSLHQGMVPPASYTPASFPPEHYEAYYNDYLKEAPEHNGTGKRRKHKRSTSRHRLQQLEVPDGRRDGSLGRRSQDSPDNESYLYHEGGIYRRQYINEKAFGSTLARGDHPSRASESGMVRGGEHRHMNGGSTLGEGRGTGKSSRPGKHRSRDRAAALEDGFHDMSITETESRRGDRHF